ncbi:MAG: hypothetical protein ABJA66_15355 [Actinomycetota bacterium]
MFSLTVRQPQQQYSNAYAFRDFGANSDNVENVEQKIRVIKPAPATQWVMTLKWLALIRRTAFISVSTQTEKAKDRHFIRFGMPTKRTGQNV